MSKSDSVEVVLIVSAILDYFTETKSGMYSDDAYVELVGKTQSWMRGELKKKDYVEYLEFTFGFDGLDEVNKVIQKAKQVYKHYKNFGCLPLEENR